jgi:hypothetical protein
MSANVSKSGIQKAQRAAALGWRHGVGSYGPCRYLREARRWRRLRRKGGVQ